MAKIKIQDSKITMGRYEVRDILSKCKDGYYFFTIEPYKRSIAQNSLMWKWFTIIGNDLGYTKEEVHGEMIELFAPIYTRRSVTTGKPKQERMTTSMMNVEQMSDFLKSVDQFAAEQDIILPEPKID